MASIAKFFIIVFAINLICGMVATMHNLTPNIDTSNQLLQTEEGLYEQINVEPAQSNDAETTIGNAVQLGGMTLSIILNSVSPFSVWYGDEDNYNGFIRLIAWTLAIIRSFILLLTILIVYSLIKNRERVL